MPLLADKYGRKWIFRISMIVYLLDLVALYFVQTATQMIVVNFINGAMTTARISIGFCYA
jgi:Na+/melibiose symporter-like transporter